MGERVVSIDKGTVEKLMELREPGPDSSEGLVDQVYSILKGIDRDETYAEDEGWWETAEGAEFGARKLSEIVDLVSEAERQLAEKDVEIERLKRLLNPASHDVREFYE